MDLNFYKGKKVFLTGHTGFKGTWLCRMLVNAGAVVTGYSLQPPTDPNLFESAGFRFVRIGFANAFHSSKALFTFLLYSRNSAFSVIAL